MSERIKRHVVSMSPEAEQMIKEIQAHMQENLPEPLQTMKVSQALAVETAIKNYLKQVKEAA